MTTKPKPACGTYKNYDDRSLRAKWAWYLRYGWANHPKNSYVILRLIRAIIEEEQAYSLDFERLE